MSILEILRSMRGQKQNDSLNAELINILNALDNNALFLSSFFSFYAEDIIHLFSALEAVPSITNLHLECISLDMWQVLYLSTNQSQEARADASAIANALKTNTTLMSLTLENTPIEENGATALVQALSQNFTLRQLKIHGYCMHDVQVSAFAKAICSIENRLITPELLIIANTSASKESLNELMKAFNFHTQNINKNLDFMNANLGLYFPESLANIIIGYMLISASETKKQKITDPIGSEIEFFHFEKKKKL